VRGASKLIRSGMVITSCAFLFLFLLAPLATILREAFCKGLEAYWASITDPAALSAFRLTVATAAMAVLFNTAFGLAAAWALAYFRFPGKSVLLTLMDVPFAASPVVSGLMWILLFGAEGWLGPWLRAKGVEVLFAQPGILLATVFVSFPYVARELMALMEKQGCEEETAAVVLGAGGWQIFRRVTLPKVRWALFYGVVLCNARAMGEFGAVSMVSGHIRGRTNTLPLHIEILYNEYNFGAAFAVASLFMALALVTLAAKSALERRLLRGGRSNEVAAGVHG